MSSSENAVMWSVVDEDDQIHVLLFDPLFGESAALEHRLPISKGCYANQVAGTMGSKMTDGASLVL
jgi:hypothetical protein